MRKHLFTNEKRDKGLPSNLAEPGTCHNVSNGRLSGSSDFTSIQQRTREYAEQRTSVDSPRLKPFSAKPKDSAHSIAFDDADDLELIDWTGRCCREDKRGHIPTHLPPILQRLNIDQNAWLKAMQPEGLQTSRAMGHIKRLKQFAQDKGLAWISSGSQFKALFV